MLDNINTASDLKQGDIRSANGSSEDGARFARILEIYERQSSLHATASAFHVQHFIVAADRSGDAKANMAELANTPNASRREMQDLIASANVPSQKLASDANAFSASLDTLKGATQARELADRSPR
mgnify:CR=1 FL=1